MTQTIKIGVLGCANIASRSILPALSKNERFHIDAIASRSMDKAVLLAKQYHAKPLGNYDELLERDIDAVYIPLPNSLHFEWINKALQKGVHVWVEKSLGVTYQEVEYLNMLAKERNLVLLENFQFRFHSQNQYAKDMLNNGELGEMRCFRSSFCFPPFTDRQNIRYNKELGGGALLDAGAYTLKATQFILGNGMNVSASKLIYDNEKKVDIYGGAFLTGTGSLFSEVCFGFDNYYQCNYEILGSKGKLVVERAFTAPPGYSPKITIEINGDRREMLLPPDDHFTNISNHFADLIECKVPNTEYDDNMEQAKLIQQVYQYAAKK
jgi:NDP-hexose-3-ketoreductase